MKYLARVQYRYYHQVSDEYECDEGYLCLHYQLFKLLISFK